MTFLGKGTTSSYTVRVVFCKYSRSESKPSVITERSLLDDVRVDLILTVIPSPESLLSRDTRVVVFINQPPHVLRVTRVHAKRTTLKKPDISKNELRTALGSVSQSISHLPISVISVLDQFVERVTFISCHTPFSWQRTEPV